jgi:hypothetical protein
VGLSLWFLVLKTDLVQMSRFSDDIVHDVRHRGD